MFDPETPPELKTSGWFKTPEPVTLEKLRGKVVVLSAFQMFCPGCVEHGLPLAQKLFERFSADHVAVIGLHTVFEHHNVAGAGALDAFIHEYGWKFPIGIDEAADAATGGKMPKTMRAYQMQGTPTLLLFDRQGRLRRHYFGKPDELMLGAEIMALTLERADAPREASVEVEKMLAAALQMPPEAQQEQGQYKDHSTTDQQKLDDPGA